MLSSWSKRKFLKLSNGGCVPLSDDSLQYCEKIKIKFYFIWYKKIRKTYLFNDSTAELTFDGKFG